MMSDFAIALPELILSLFAMASLLVAVYTGKDNLTDALTWATAGLMGALALWIGVGQSGTRVAFGGMFVDDAFARFAKVMILVSYQKLSFLAILVPQRLLKLMNQKILIMKTLLQKLQLI